MRVQQPFEIIIIIFINPQDMKLNTSEECRANNRIQRIRTIFRCFSSFDVVKNKSQRFHRNMRMRDERYFKIP